MSCLDCALSTWIYEVKNNKWTIGCCKNKSMIDLNAKCGYWCSEKGDEIKK